MQGFGSKRGRMRRQVTIAAVVVVVIAAGLAATAGAIRMQVGDIVIHGDGTVIPSKMPRYENAPLRLKMHGKLSTISGELPPVIRHILLEVDGDGEIETKGLPVCSSGTLQSTTVNAARKLCPKAIVGKGMGRGIVAFPDQPGIDVSSPLTVFNGPSGPNRWTIYVHAHITIPVPAAIVAKVDVKRIDNGPYGYLVETEIPKIAGGAGIPISAQLEIGHEWNFKGQRLSYLNGHCPDGKLQAQGKFSFKDGTVVRGVFLKPCSVRP